MSTFLNIGEIQPAAQVSPAAAVLRQEKAKAVKKLGILALLLAIVGTFIPFLGFFMLIAALIVSRSALRISRESLVPVEFEKPAYWASIVSTLVLILSVIGLFWLLMNS